MKWNVAAQQLLSSEALDRTTESILEAQLPSGEIPWFTDGHSDPWDHTEAAMGLVVAGEIAAAQRAYRWLAQNQLEDGSWWASYRDGEPESPTRRESNYVAYIATGLWHYYLATGDREFLQELYTPMARAIEFVINLQSDYGEIDWAVDAEGAPLGDALLTGCSSIYKSLLCAISIAKLLGYSCSQWIEARERLGDVIAHQPERFDRTWESKSRYAMDWFYPILAGCITGHDARARLATRWDEFVEPELGCRCENHQPWVTVAESCELVMALAVAGQRDLAQLVFSWLPQWQAENGGWWTGYQFHEQVLWPLEQPTWTAGAVLLAVDILAQQTAASALFLSNDLIVTPRHKATG